MAFRSETEILTWSTPWSDLPDDIKAHFSAEEELAYQGGAPYLRAIADRSGVPALRELFSVLDEDDYPIRVYVVRQGNRPATVWFWFVNEQRALYPRYRLASGAPFAVAIPACLAGIYSAFQGICLGDDVEAGLHEPRLLTKAELDAYEDSVEALYGSVLVQFFSYGNGDVVCWADGADAYLLEHETHTIQRRPLDEFVQEFLDDLLQPAPRNLLAIMRGEAKRPVEKYANGLTRFGGNGYRNRSP